MPWNVAQAVVLFGSALLAIWVGATAFERQSVPGRTWLGWLQFAIAFWCVTSGLHALVASTPHRILISQFQYFGIMALPACWLEFARGYTRRPPSPTPWLVWVIPAATVGLALSNGSHHLLWREIREVPTATGYILLQYVHGPWFAVTVGFTYVALATGTIWLGMAVRQQPSQYRLQSSLIIGGLAAPWIANMIYLAGWVRPGFDPTPVGFAVSGVLFGIGLFRYRLFDLVPVARTVLFDSLGDAAFVIDREGRIVDSNAAARALAGGETPAMGRPIDEVLRWWNRRPRLGASSAIVRVDGRAMDVQLRPVLDAARELSAWLVLVRDVTEKEHAEAQRRALDHRLMEQQKVETLSLLAGGLAHDFKSLLTGVIGNADLARQHASEPDVIEAADAILAAAERAVELVARMQDYAGSRPPRSEAVDLGVATADMVTLMQRSTARHCTVTAVPPATPIAAAGDPTQIRQILLNLIGNAAEAVEPGGEIRIAISSGTREETSIETATFDGTRPYAAGGPARYAVIDVTDDGIGMPEATLSRIFDPYFTTKATGRGLGLSAVLGIVRGHQGAIRVTSVSGEGTSFRVWLPAAA